MSTFLTDPAPICERIFPEGGCYDPVQPPPGFVGSAQEVCEQPTGDCGSELQLRGCIEQQPCKLLELDSCYFEAIGCAGLMGGESCQIYCRSPSIRKRKKVGRAAVGRCPLHDTDPSQPLSYVVFLNDADAKMVHVRKTKFTLKLEATGMDVQHKPDARAVLTLGKDRAWKDYCQEWLDKGDNEIYLGAALSLRGTRARHTRLAHGVANCTWRRDHLHIHRLRISRIRLSSFVYGMISYGRTTGCQAFHSRTWATVRFPLRKFVLPARLAFRGSVDFGSLDSCRCSPAS
ncbi:unnamed protein product [Symbiodinium sp. CCMP2592]|nr:unnamed protein product [Symbiodinium sp. CCMP2592]